MWKDFFYYTKSERRAILLLLVVVAVLLGIAIFKQKDVAGYYAVLPDTCGIDSFLKQLVEADAEFSSPRKQKTHTVPVLHAFDPNTADSVTLLQLGLPPLWCAISCGIVRKEEFSVLRPLFRRFTDYLQTIIIASCLICLFPKWKARRHGRYCPILSGRSSRKIHSAHCPNWKKERGFR